MLKSVVWGLTLAGAIVDFGNIPLRLRYSILASVLKDSDGPE